ncbi:hypothetical protein HYH03_011931 [Edaphochlamys debaryana]|uniref:Nephrocystin 3-like N-terminal domain-containing protein n=1 Tax=Edaphochlamys debaryana TaxID=47281 RepID=A0A835XV80_9CHLO|nr:hypothetical protein HYH03_011931 [Edaphochlamys debaryana]|eukprot:KAG2489653.1 hypothetical protein HYH03_011931 [Edaphochlamys debaryana]
MLDAGVGACSGGTIVVMDPKGDAEETSPTWRAWCMYEWARTLDVYGTDGLHLPRLRPEGRAQLFAGIAIEGSKTKDPKDKERIIAAVLQQYGSTAKFNAILKLQLLLEPLRYKVDQERLMGQAEALGTQWRLEPVDEWLAAGAGGERALVISAGAGEGKSTIAAALVKHRPQAITAHHFLKYNDQRRLEPIRIIKSLAAQLAER